MSISERKSGAYLYWYEYSHIKSFQTPAGGHSTSVFSQDFIKSPLHFIQVSVINQFPHFRLFQSPLNKRFYQAFPSVSQHIKSSGPKL